MSSGNKTRYVILGLLSEAPLSGYDLKKLIGIRFSGFWSESYGQIYPELKRLEKEGMVKKIPTNSTRSRNLYMITETGRRLLVSWVGEPSDKEIVRYEILLKLYFGHLSKTENLIAQITDFRNNHLLALQQLDGFETELRSILTEHENHPFVLMTIGFGQKVYRTYLEWCDEAIKTLSDIQKKRAVQIKEGGSES